MRRQTSIHTLRVAQPVVRVCGEVPDLTRVQAYRQLLTPPDPTRVPRAPRRQARCVARWLRAVWEGGQS